MVTADGVVVRDGPTGGHEGIHCHGLDLVPLRELAPSPCRSEDREVRRDAVDIGMRCAACDDSAAAGVDQRSVDRGGDRLDQLGELLPHDGRLERFYEYAEEHKRLPEVRSSDERAAPRVT